MIGERIRIGLAPAGKGSRRALSAAALLAAVCVLVAACDAGHDDARTPSGTAQATPMLPGTRGTTASSQSAGAQRFDMAGGSEQRGASDALLPPVMHSAD